MPRIDLGIYTKLHDSATKELKTLESGIIRAVGAITAALAAVSVAVFPVKAAAAFERELRNVQKTTGFTDEGISRLNRSLLNMSRNLGVGAVELANIAAIAGQLGLGSSGVEAIEKFTKSVAIATTTLNIGAEALAEYSAQSAAIFSLDPGGVEKLFSAVNELSNTTVASGKDIFDVMKRIGTVAGEAVQDTAALSATIKQLGTSNEVGATFITKLFVRMSTEADKFADAMGVSTDRWNAILATDGKLKAFIALNKKLARIPASELTESLKDLGGEGARSLPVFLKFVNDARNEVTELEKALASSNRTYEDGQSSLVEYETIMDSVVAQLEILKESFNALLIDAGNQVLPILQVKIRELSAAFKDPAVKQYFVDFGKGLADVLGWVTKVTAELASYTDAWKAILFYAKALIAVGVIKWFARLSFAMAELALGPIVKLIAGYKLAKEAIIKFTAATKTAYAVQMALGRATAGTAAAAGAHAGVGAFMATANAGLLRLNGSVAKSTGLLAKLSAAFAILGRTLVTKFGLVGIAIGVIAYNFDAILGIARSLFGYTSAASRKLAAQARIEAEEAADRAANAKAAYEEMVEKIEQDAREGTAAAPRAPNLLGDGATLTSFATGMKQALTDVATYGKNIANIQVDAKKVNVEYELWSDKLEAAKKRATGLEEILDFRKGALKDALDTGGSVNISRAREEVDKVGEAILRLERETESVISNLNAVSGEKLLIDKQATVLIDDFIGKFDKELPKAIQTSLLEYARLKKAALDLRDASKEAVDTQELAQARADALKYSEPVEAAAAKEEADKAKLAVDTLDLAIKATASSLEEIGGSIVGVSKTTKAYIDGISTAEQLGELVHGLDLLSLSADGFDKHLASISEEMKVQAATFKVGYELYNKLAIQAEVYAKTAKSVFDNTAKEIAAAGRRFQKYAISFKDRLNSRDNRIQFDIDIREVEDDFEEKQEKITKYYDYWIDKATGAAKKILEAKKKAVLEELEFEKQQELADREKVRLSDELASGVERVTSLYKKAREAAASKEFEKSLEFKEAAKRAQNHLGDILDDMLELRTVAGGGSLLPAFSDAELEEGFTSVADLAKQTSVEIADTNSLLNNEASRQAKLLRDNADEYKALLTQVSGKVDIIASKYVNFKAQVEAATEAIREQTTAFATLQGLAANPAAAVQSATDFTEIKVGISDDSIPKITKQLEQLPGVHGEPLKIAVKAEIKNSVSTETEKAAKEVARSFESKVRAVRVPVSISTDLSDAEQKSKEYATLWVDGVQNYVHKQEVFGPEFEDPSREASDSVVEYSDAWNTKMSTTPMKANVVYDEEQLRNDAIAAGDNMNLEMEASIDSLDALDAIGGVQQDIDNTTFTGTIELEPKYAGGGSVIRTGYASGGAVSGAGSSTSDSIPAWLSNGEWVMDAMTTKYFGGSFFAGLQAIAKGRRHQPSSKGGLPAFAEGGPVSGGNVTTLNLNLGGKETTLYGAKEAVDVFVDAMTDLEKGLV